MTQKKEMTLKEMIKLMQFYNNHGFNTFVQGNGDGKIKLIIEDEFVTFK